MTMFHDRELAFEAKFAHDAEFLFLTAARRDRLFANWAADRMGLPDPARAGFVAEVMALRDGAGHDARLLAHVAAVFMRDGTTPPDAELATALASCTVQARQQLIDGLGRAVARPDAG